MKRNIWAPVILFILTPASVFPQNAGQAGAFSRLGFGARGVGMGNALTAVSTGDVVSYYNPAALSRAPYRNVTASFGILSLDRALNFIGFTQPVQPNAGIFVGLINAGVSNIDGRDADGVPTGPLRTSENEAFLGFAARFSPTFSGGLNLKLLYHHLYTDVSSTTVSVDVGALVSVTQSLAVGVTVRDINSKYKWDTSSLYGDQSGKVTTDKFPLLVTIGGAYSLPDSLGLIAADIERSDQATLLGRFGVEVPLVAELTVRAGIDRIDLRDKGNGVRPSFGFTARKTLSNLTPEVTYAFAAEPFAPSQMHIVSLSLIF